MKKNLDNACYNYSNNCSRWMTILFLSLFIIIFFVSSIYADNTILINEFLIDPTPQQVEIINTGTQSADISGWYIDDNGGSTYYTIPQSSILYPNACMVFSGDFNLNKSSSDTVRLFNNSTLIDSFSYKSSSSSGISYLRLPDGTNNWTTKSASLGLYNDNGLSCIVTPTPTISPTIKPTETPYPTPVSYSNIFISEVMTNPPAGGNEWVELFNNNDYSVSLINWFIDDIENGGSSPKLFSLDIPAKNYGVINLSSSMFNNTGDSVRLLDFNKNLIDDFEYSGTTQGKTLGRISYDSNEFCLQESSKGISNNSCINPSPTSQPTQSPTKISTPSKIPTYLSVTAVMNRLVTPMNLPAGRQVESVEEGEVLGISDQNGINTHSRLIRSLSFVSFSYSLLTILSIFLKMKNSYEKDL